jgi:hypothetical protein
MRCRPNSRAISLNADTHGSRAARFSAGSFSTIAATGCLRPIRCGGEIATAITSARRSHVGARPVRDRALVPMRWSELSSRRCVDNGREIVKPQISQAQKYANWFEALLIGSSFITTTSKSRSSSKN